jgi:Ni/Fe-hydrogenase 1 B-type cytochrome subunit
MNTTESETLSLERRRVYDPFIRLLHWWNALAIVMLAASSQIAEWMEDGPYGDAGWQVHVVFGYALALGLGLRVVWGLVGPASARWSDMWHPAAWREALRARRLAHGRGFGHDPLASAAYLGAFALMALMVVTGLGLAAAEFGAGPLAGWEKPLHDLRHTIKEPHEVGFYLILGFIVVHIAALIFHERRGVPLAQGMVSGYQYRELAEREQDADDERP